MGYDRFLPPIQSKNLAKYFLDAAEVFGIDDEDDDDEDIIGEEDAISDAED